MRSRPSVLLSLLVPLAAACPGLGDDSTGTGTDTESAGTTTTESTTDGATSTSVGTESPTSTGIGTTDEPPVCEPPVNEEPGQAGATITIRNAGAIPVYVLPKSQFVCNYTQIEIDIDGVNVHWDHPGVYPYPCDATRCQWGCSDGGWDGLIINPGATAEIPWNGAVWADETLSDACVEEFCPQGGVECEARRALTDVTYTARVQITDTCPGELDVCEACVEGVCNLFVYEPNSFPTLQSFEATATFPEGAAIVIE